MQEHGKIIISTAIIFHSRFHVELNFICWPQNKQRCQSNFVANGNNNKLCVCVSVYAQIVAHWPTWVNWVKMTNAIGHSNNKNNNRKHSMSNTFLLNICWPFFGFSFSLSIKTVDSRYGESQRNYKFLWSTLWRKS